MENNKLKTEELDKVLDSVSSEEQLQEYLDRYTNKDGYGFCQYFNEYLAEHDAVHAQVIADCNLDKDYATQITNGTKRNPSRDKALALCIAAGIKKDTEDAAVLQPETRRTTSRTGIRRRSTCGESAAYRRYRRCCTGASRETAARG